MKDTHMDLVNDIVNTVQKNQKETISEIAINEDKALILSVDFWLKSIFMMVSTTALIVAEIADKYVGDPQWVWE